MVRVGRGETAEDVALKFGVRYGRWQEPAEVSDLNQGGSENRQFVSARRARTFWKSKCLSQVSGTKYNRSCRDNPQLDRSVVRKKYFGD